MGRPAEEDGFSGATLAQEEDNTLVRRGLDLKGGGRRTPALSRYPRCARGNLSRAPLEARKPVTLERQSPHLEDTPRMSASIRIIGLIRRQQTQLPTAILNVGSNETNSLGSRRFCSWTSTELPGRPSRLSGALLV